MYVDMSIEFFNWKGSSFNVRCRLYDEQGTEIGMREWEHVSWSTGCSKARAFYLARKAALGAKNTRSQNNGAINQQMDLPFDVGENLPKSE